MAAEESEAIDLLEETLVSALATVNMFFMFPLRVSQQLSLHLVVNFLRMESGRPHPTHP